MTPHRAYLEISEQISEIRRTMIDLDSRNKRRLRKKLESLSQSNCWFAVYHCKESLLWILDDIHRESVRCNRKRKRK